MACPDIGFPPILLLFPTLDSSLRHAGSSHRLTQTPLRRTRVGRGTNKSSASQICQQILLLHVLEIPCRKVSVTTARFPALGRAQKLFILLIRKREDSALPNTTPLFCLGAIRLCIFWDRVYPIRCTPLGVRVMFVCVTQNSVHEIQRENQQRFIQTSKSSHTTKKDHSHTLLLKN